MSKMNLSDNSDMEDVSGAWCNEKEYGCYSRRRIACLHFTSLWNSLRQQLGPEGKASDSCHGGPCLGLLPVLTRCRSTECIRNKEAQYGVQGDSQDTRGQIHHPI